MYQSHDVFVQPEEDIVKVWRYMDFTKFLWLLEQRCLYFSRADRLGDPFEGSWPRLNVLARKYRFVDIPSEGGDGDNDIGDIEGEFSKKLLKTFAVNCWHMGNHESAAMWRLYLKSNEGVAVQSTYARLRDSLIEPTDIFLGTVRYVDYSMDTISSGNVLAPIMHKRMSFEYEQEVRAVIWRMVPIDGQDAINLDEISAGISVQVDVDRLVENVYVAPTSDTWFLALTEAVVKRYGYNFNILRSSLNDEPLF